jgi:hypothetical protein
MEAAGDHRMSTWRDSNRLAVVEPWPRELVRVLEDQVAELPQEFVARRAHLRPWSAPNAGARGLTARSTSSAPAFATEVIGSSVAGFSGLKLFTRVRRRACRR